jgi:hypothetical protein
VIPGLWGLTFERDERFERDCEFEADRLCFTARPGGEQDGLLGVLRPVSRFFRLRADFQFFTRTAPKINAPKAESSPGAVRQPDRLASLTFADWGGR